MCMCVCVCVCVCVCAGTSPSGPVVKTLHFHCRGTGSIPGQGTKIPHIPYGMAKKKKLTIEPQAALLIS